MSLHISESILWTSTPVWTMPDKITDTVLVDSKAIGVFINHSFVEKCYINTYKFSKPIPVFNIDSTLIENN